MRKSISLHPIILLGACSLIVSACGDNSNSEMNEAAETSEEENTDTSENINSETIDTETEDENENDQETQESSQNFNNNEENSDEENSPEEANELDDAENLNDSAEGNEQNSNENNQQEEALETGNNENQNSEVENNNPENDNSGDNADNNETKEEIPEDDVAEIVFDYMEENEDFETEDVKIMVDDREEEGYRAQVFSFVPEDAEQQATQTLRWYYIDKVTGEVRNETTGMEEENEETEEENIDWEEGNTSELVSMSEEKREAHHRNIASSKEHLMDQVYDHLLLPGVHENTISYEGRVGPEETIRFEFTDAEDISDRSIVDLEVDEEGYFQVDMRQYDFSAGEEIIVRIAGGGYPQEQVFELPVHPAEEGIEHIRVR
ncbi:hypothetical protein [Alkalicoccus daliensis]|uniref:Uncharacterized protein n=1 Tax=Alkalicoccus daliensis TaxID=745820 RepID=A0A1H0D7I3_9BACI|nr:hypothetical protein [Alkalicoccus daliensis]SDN66065.1 hypothetical protein SAMN04488053_102372 [Alkalicoccus daliensis]